MDKIVRISRVLRYCFELGSLTYVGALVMMVVFWSDAPHSFYQGKHLSLTLGIGVPLQHSFTVSQRVFGFLAQMPGLFLGFYCLRLLARLFKNFSNQQVLSLINVSLLHRIGLVLLISKLLIIPTDLFTSWLLSERTISGKLAMGFKFTDDDILISLIAGVLIVVSWIMAEAYKLQEEQKYTI